MPGDDTPSDSSRATDTKHERPGQTAIKRSAWDTLFEVPRPLKRIFDQFPLASYPANELPGRSPRHGQKNVLHIFTFDEAAKKGRPSFNPACLKWQAYLKFCGIAFQTVVSNNHASPSGALPFLTLAPTDGNVGTVAEVVPANRLKRWLNGQLKEKLEETEDARYEAYASLLEHRIRRAWVWQRISPSHRLCADRACVRDVQLYQLYLNPSNAALLHALYIAPCSSNPFVQLTIAHQLRTAASAEISKSNPTSTPNPWISTVCPPTHDAESIMEDAYEALFALSQLLGNNDWFFGQQQPGFFDASVFAYTQLLLDKELGGVGWGENEMLGKLKSQYPNLVAHRGRVVGRYFW